MNDVCAINEIVEEVTSVVIFGGKHGIEIHFSLRLLMQNSSTNLR